MPIFVKTLRGKTIIVYVEASSDISGVKEKIAEKEGIPPTLQSLVFAGRQLGDREKLEEYKIRKDRTIWLTLRLVGGIAKEDREVKKDASSSRTEEGPQQQQ